MDNENDLTHCEDNDQVNDDQVKDQVNEKEVDSFFEEKKKQCRHNVDMLSMELMSNYSKYLAKQQDVQDEDHDHNNGNGNGDHRIIRQFHLYESDIRQSILQMLRVYPDENHTHDDCFWTTEIKSLFYSCIDRMVQHMQKQANDHRLLDHRSLDHRSIARTSRPYSYYGAPDDDDEVDDDMMFGESMNTRTTSTASNVDMQSFSSYWGKPIRKSSGTGSSSSTGTGTGTGTKKDVWNK